MKYKPLFGDDGQVIHSEEMDEIYAVIESKVKEIFDSFPDVNPKHLELIVNHHFSYEAVCKVHRDNRKETL